MDWGPPAVPRREPEAIITVTTTSLPSPLGCAQSNVKSMAATAFCVRMLNSQSGETIEVNIIAPNSQEAHWLSRFLHPQAKIISVHQMDKNVPIPPQNKRLFKTA